MGTNLLRATRVLRVLRVPVEQPVEYGAALRLQEALVAQRKDGLIPDTVVQLEHPPTYTLGKRGKEADLLQGEAELAALGASVFRSARGGEATFHGPGQTVVYPIVNLRELGRCGVRKYVEGLEDSMARTAGIYGIHARGRVAGRTGVWVGDKKIGAIGVRVTNGITSHGMALNVNTDLSFFAHIIPCGIPDRDVTSIAQEVGSSVPTELVAMQLVESFARCFKYQDVYLEHFEAGQTTE